MLEVRMEKIMQITDYLSEPSVLFLDSTDKNEVLASMVAHAARLGLVPDEHAFKKALLEREALMSTDIGWQVAIPHAKMPGIPEFFVIPTILSHDSDWGGGEGQTVRLIFLIGGPSGRQTDYLKILSKITLVIKNKTRRESLLKAQDAKSVLAAFAGL
ncbi:MAG: PTS sugar transporter subunit IIA [Spirochaetia bacterium]|nr:PTS sugar transporter subunit IIA [Spirochaetia bacterium]